MARVCQVTGKKPMVGNNVSHANNKTKRRFLPNLQSRKFWVESENRWVRLRVSNAALRTIDKKGIDVVIAELRADGLVIESNRRPRLCRPLHNHSATPPQTDTCVQRGAGNETRTRDPNLGKVVLYQLSYSRNLRLASFVEVVIMPQSKNHCQTFLE